MGIGDNAVTRKARAQAQQSVRWALGHGLPNLLVRGSRRRGDLQAQLIAASKAGDPFPIFEQLRQHGPVYRGRFAFVVTSHPVAKEVLTSNDFGAGFGIPTGDNLLSRAFRWADQTEMLGPLRPPSLLVTEPPDHTRYRRLVSGVFSVRAVERLRERTEAIATELLDGLEPLRHNPVELVEQYCTLLPVTVIAEILGVPLTERERVLSFGAAAAPSLDFGLSWRVFRQVEAALADFDAWLSRHIAELRRNPGDDLLSQLVAARDDEGGLDERELKATAGLVLAAGFETTVNLLGNGVALLCEHPDQLALVTEQPDRWTNAVEEVLRIDPPVLLTGRSVLRDTTVGKTQMSGGSFVTTLLAAANRDPAIFTDPSRFDVTRPNAREHVSFFCRPALLSGRGAGADGGRGRAAVALRTLSRAAHTPGPARRRSTRHPARCYETLPVQLGEPAVVPTR